MPRQKHTIIEYRNYDLPAHFPVLLLTGDIWRISDVRSGRLHFHNCLEIGLCETDHGIMEFMDSVCPFSAGDVTVVASDVSHTTYSAPGTASKWSYIYIDVDELFHSYFPLNTLAKADILQHVIHTYYAILPQKNHPDIHQLVIMIIDELKKQESNYQFTVRGLILALLTKLINICSDDENTGTDVLQMHENSLIIAPALDFIRKNYMQDFTMDSLSSLCHMSSTHFRRTFTSIMGTGPLEYLNRIRIAKAAILLRTTEMPVLDISEEVGFHSVSSFNRHFSEIMGVTPMKWRKQMSYMRNQSIQKYTGWMEPPKDLKPE